MRRHALIALLAPALALAACQGGSGTGGDGGLVVEAGTADSMHAHPPGEGAAEEALPLRAIMQRLGNDITGLTHALMMDDTTQLRARSEAIAAHPHMLASEVERIRRTLGPEMADFEAADERVHHAAERLHEAALAGRPDVVADRLAEVQKGCVSCHMQFRDRLRTDR